MPFDQSHQLAAAASSARARRTRNLLQRLANTPPLTADQKQALIEAARNIPVVAA